MVSRCVPVFGWLNPPFYGSKLPKQWSFKQIFTYKTGLLYRYMLANIHKYPAYQGWEGISPGLVNQLHFIMKLVLPRVLVSQLRCFL